jgi:hypothetical protein
MQPSMKSVMRPTLLLPASLSMPRNGRGVSSIKKSRNMLLAVCAANMAKNSLGFLLPQPMHLPGTSVFQYFSTGLHENIDRRKNVRPHIALAAMRTMHTRRAIRYCVLVVDDEDSENRRRYWNRMASLIKVALAQ